MHNMSFAAKTEVSSDKSRAEIERMLLNSGASEFAYMTSREQCIIVFTMKTVRYRFTLPLPDRDAFGTTPNRRRQRTTAAKEQAYEQSVRSKWRSLALAIKARLVSVEDGIDTFEEAFMSKIVIPGVNKTAGEYMLPQIEECYLSSKPMPPLLGWKG